MHIVRAMWLLGVRSSVLALAAPFLALAQTTEPANRPNFVLIMADDQGWGDMAYNGHPHVKTPHFDALASQAVRFDRFYAAGPVCSPTRASVLTGRTPNRSATFKWGHPLDPREQTLSAVLQAAGYRTGHFGKWHLGSVQAAGQSTPGKCGFDTWVSAPNFYDLDPILSDRGKAVPFRGDSSDIAADLALKFIRECAAAKQPFLAVVWFGSPHAPHQALPADRELYADRPPEEANFLGEITAMDRAVGRVREGLRTLGLRDNTVLWYCSDNGALPRIGSSGGRRGAKASIYEGGLLVPALLEWPARYPRPQVIDVPCVTSDIYPTVLEIAGVAVPHQRPLDGQSLLPILDGKSHARRHPIGFWDHPTPGVRVQTKEWMEELFAEQQAGREPADPAKLFADAGKRTQYYPLDRFPGHAAWLDGDWKLHRIEGFPAGKKGKGTANEVRWELYNLSLDPTESRDLLHSEPQRAARMQQELTDWLTSVARSLNGEDYQ